MRVYASRSDRHIIIMDKRAPIINPNYMVLFDENDTFHVREVWDDRYNATFNSSIHDYTMEISEDGKSAGVSVCCTCFRRILSRGRSIEIFYFKRARSYESAVLIFRIEYICSLNVLCVGISQHINSPA